eukprot:11729513-Heterocapsa_arctica.AAC.1
MARMVSIRPVLPMFLSKQNWFASMSFVLHPLVLRRFSSGSPRLQRPTHSPSPRSSSSSSRPGRHLARLS